MKNAFFANPGLNIIIGTALAIGIIHAFMQVFRLYPEINWVNNFHIKEPGKKIPHTPKLIAPMAAMLRDKPKTLSPISLGSLLDSISARLNEARDLSRYLIGLLVFLGLLGTFWGLLETITSVGQIINALDIQANEPAILFQELKTGLEAPLAGMGIAFSSSLFGLAGSLILGFLDLQTNQAQNRFYNNLEEWLSSITDINIKQENMTHAYYSGIDLKEIRDSLFHISNSLQNILQSQTQQNNQNQNQNQETKIPQKKQDEEITKDDKPVLNLAQAIGELVGEMRNEQKIIRQWAQIQADKNEEIIRNITKSENHTNDDKQNK